VTQNPTNQTVLAGTTATFSVSAKGATPLKYQWFKGGQIVDGATNSVLIITNSQIADSGLYQLLITNSYGSATSAPVKLWVTMNTFDLGMVAYFPFTQNAHDESGNGYDGSVQGASLISDRFGAAGFAYAFDGMNDEIVMRDTTNLNLSSGGLTLCAWVALTGNNIDQHVVSKHVCGSPNGYIIAVYENKPFFFVGGDIRLLMATDPLPTDGSWHSIVGTFDGEVQRLYVDGLLVGTLAKAYTTLNDAPLKVGRYTGGAGCYTPGYFFGYIDDVRVYSRALTTNEVVALYAFEWPDADKDGLNDVEELNVYHTDPNKWDTDGDSLSDYKELKVYHTNPLNSDSDGDGYNDHAEVYAGKDPNNAAEHPAAYLSAFTAIELEFITQNGKTYQIQSSPDLINWTDFDQPIAGNGDIWKKVYSTREQGQRYYRVELSQ
jgi:hypothetical protein